MPAQEQHLFYEVGAPETADLWGPGYHISRYGKADEVHPSTFGLPVRDQEHWAHTLRQSTHRWIPTDAVRDVPLHSIWGTQEYVYAPHVRNLATVPGSKFAPLLGVEHSDGTIETEDHHRVAAAHLRGDTHVRMEIIGRLEPTTSPV